MTTMIALVGEQPQPNFLPVLHYEPDHVVFVYSAKTRQKYTYLKDELERRTFAHKKILIDGIETDAYHISTIITELNNYLAKLPANSSEALLFNLTGGTKPMSLAAYQVAVQRNAPVIYLQSEKGQSIVDFYIWKGDQLYHQKQETLNEHLNLHDALNLHLGGGKDPDGKDYWIEKGPHDDGNDGHLFEAAIAQALREHNYETMCGIRGKDNIPDIDVIARHQNQIGIIEAKSGQKNLFKGIQQLSTAMRFLGGTYTKQFLVLNGQLPDDQAGMCKVLNIHIISLLSYQKGMTTLPPEDVKILKDSVDQVMRVKTA